MGQLKTYAFIAILIISTLLITGCNNIRESRAVTPGPTVFNSEGLDNIPVKIACLQDKTKSVQWAPTPQASMEDFDLLVKLLRQRGGEIGFGLIRDRSNKGLLRLRVETPPLGPPPPIQPRNQFKAAELRAAYQKQVQVYEGQFQEWKSETDKRVSRFLTSLKLLLEQDTNALRSDIVGAINRADSFLAENDVGWKHPTKRWAVFVTDGKDNVHVRSSNLNSGAIMVVVNGGGDLGVLKYLKPARFESVPAAFRFIVASEEK